MYLYVLCIQIYMYITLCVQVHVLPQCHCGGHIVFMITYMLIYMYISINNNSDFWIKQQL